MADQTRTHRSCGRRSRRTEHDHRDTGTVAGDLHALAHTVVANVGSEGGARRSRSIVAAAANSDELAAGMNTYWAQRLAASTPAIERAIERCELPPNSDSNLIIETLIGRVRIRLLFTGDPAPRPATAARTSTGRRWCVVDSEAFSFDCPLLAACEHFR